MGKRIFSLFFCLCLLLSLAPRVDAAQLDGVNLAVSIDGGDLVTVKAYQSSYGNNLLISLRDLAAALSGTDKAFDIAIEPDEESGTHIAVRMGSDYIPVGGENEPTDDLEVADSFYASTAYNKLYIDEQEMRLPTYLHTESEERPADIYLRLVDLGMYWNLALAYTGEDALSIDTAADYVYDLMGLEADGYFQDLHAIVLADADTGCILYGSNADQPTQIASTTKLMTYLLVKEALDAGAFAEDSLYTVSEEVYRLANSEDGIYRRSGKYGTLKEGDQVTVEDLLKAMLMISANEAATALAEMVSGSEEAFAQLMNQRAQELGLTSAVFYNPHGLPSYTQDATTTKRQNEMSAGDMFRLVQYLLQHYREHLTAITRQIEADLPSFGQTKDGVTAYTRNTNSLLYNLPDCLGFKTGTTNRSGSNLVAGLPVTDSNGDTHDLVVVIFGAEDDAERYEKSTWLLKYAQQYYAANPFPQEQPVAVTEAAPTETAATVPTEETVPTTVATEATLPAVVEPEEPASLVTPVTLALMGVSCFAGMVVTLLVVLLIRAVTKKRRKTYDPRFMR